MSDAIERAAICDHTLSGDCAGTQSPYYQIPIELDGGSIRSATCTCLYDFGGYCKHIVALLLAYVHAPKQFAARQEPDELLADLGREQWLALVTKLLRERPDFYD